MERCAHTQHGVQCREVTEINWTKTPHSKHAHLGLVPVHMSSYPCIYIDYDGEDH